MDAEFLSRGPINAALTRRRGEGGEDLLKETGVQFNIYLEFRVRINDKFGVGTTSVPGYYMSKISQSSKFDQGQVRVVD